MSDNIEYTVELKERQWEYLEEMTKKYDIQDASKTLRCLINYAIESGDQEEDIYEEIRCLDC